MKGLEAAASRPLEFRTADALSFATDILAVDVEWVGDADALETGALRFRFLSHGGRVGQAMLGAPAPTRAWVVFAVRGLRVGLHTIEAALVDETGRVVASGEKPCFVIPGFHG